MMWRLIRTAIMIAGIRRLWGNKLVRKMVMKRLTSSTKRLLPI
jgi:hypothetical protein